MQLNYMRGMNTSASALTAYRQWMNTISENIANAQTTRTADGGPYRRKRVLFQEVQRPLLDTAARPRQLTTEPVRTHRAHMTAPASRRTVAEEAPVVAARVLRDTSTPLTQVYDPGHPDAGADGVVLYPNVNPVTEMVNLILASRAYEANVAALAADKRMQEMALSIGRV